MLIGIRGQYIDDPWFVAWLRSSYYEGGLPIHEALARAGYNILEIEDSTEDKNHMEDEDFIEQVDTYAIYKAMSEVDGIIDIAQRIGPDDDPYEVQEAVQEILRLAESAIQYLETVTGDTEDEDILSSEDQLYPEDGWDEEGQDE